jgi:hypothetical protein
MKVLYSVQTKIKCNAQLKPRTKTDGLKRTISIPALL